MRVQCDGVGIMLRNILVKINKEIVLYPVDCGPKTCGKCMYISIRDKILSKMRHKPNHKDTKKFPCQCDVFHIDLDNHMGIQYRTSHCIHAEEKYNEYLKGI